MVSCACGGAAYIQGINRGEEKMTKRIIAAALIGVLALTMFSCRKKEDKPDPQEVADLVVAACDEIALDVVPAAQDAIDVYIEAKEKDEARKREKEKKKKEEEENADDPANADSTAETGQNSTVDAMTKRYVGRWEQQGLIQSDGNLDTSTGSHCTYVFSSDHTYTARGVDVNGEKIKENGTWELNSNKQIVAGKYTMGIDESGYLLKDTGERDGKGRKMKYAFSKVN